MPSWLNLISARLRSRQHNRRPGVVLGAVEVCTEPPATQVSPAVAAVGVWRTSSSREGVHLGGTGVVVDGREATGRDGGHEDDPSSSVQAQRLDVDAGAHVILEQRNLVDVDGQQVVRGKATQRQRGAAVGAETCLEIRGPTCGGPFGRYVFPD